MSMLKADKLYILMRELNVVIINGLSMFKYRLQILKQFMSMLKADKFYILMADINVQVINGLSMFNMNSRYCITQC